MNEHQVGSTPQRVQLPESNVSFMVCTRHVAPLKSKGFESFGAVESVYHEGVGMVHPSTPEWTQACQYEQALSLLS